MVLGSDGRKMSKSLKNYASGTRVLTRWVLTPLGNGLPEVEQPVQYSLPSPNDEYGKRFLVKLVIFSFTCTLLEDNKPPLRDTINLQHLDTWIISKTET
jgi:isoleucyl-tRNA synthetase